MVSLGYRVWCWNIVVYLFIIIVWISLKNDSITMLTGILLIIVYVIGLRVVIALLLAGAE